MKLNRQYILLAFIAVIGIGAYSFIPNFEREDFDPEKIEEISSGNITTTTEINEINNEENSNNNSPQQETKEEFENNIYDDLLINNSTKRIDNIFTSYLIIGSDQRS